nr:MAG TPA: hypothetical protein [Caudoviricetes sp.]
MIYQKQMIMNGQLIFLMNLDTNANLPYVLDD